MTPTVSVILCTFQQKPWLQRAIDSVLAQTFTDLELLIVDNGSTDGSDEICYAALADSRVDCDCYVENAPVTKRLNDAIAKARGKWISILYGDDYYLPEKLEVQVRYAEKLAKRPIHHATPHIIYGPSYRLYADGSMTIDPTCRASGDILIHLFKTAITEGFINPISPLVRRCCFSPIDSTPELDACIPGEPFDESVFMEGETWYWRAALRWSFHFLDTPLVVMRSHGANEGLKVERNFGLALALHDKLVPRLLWPDDQRAALEYYNQLRVHFAWYAIRMAQDRELAAKILRPLRRVPRGKYEWAARLCASSEWLTQTVNTWRAT